MVRPRSATFVKSPAASKASPQKVENDGGRSKGNVTCDGNGVVNVVVPTAQPPRIRTEEGEEGEALRQEGNLRRDYYGKGGVCHDDDGGEENDDEEEDGSASCSPEEGSATIDDDEDSSSSSSSARCAASSSSSSNESSNGSGESEVSEPRYEEGGEKVQSQEYAALLDSVCTSPRSDVPVPAEAGAEGNTAPEEGAFDVSILAESARIKTADKNAIQHMDRDSLLGGSSPNKTMVEMTPDPRTSSCTISVSSAFTPDSIAKEQGGYGDILRALEKIEQHERGDEVKTEGEPKVGEEDPPSPSKRSETTTITSAYSGSSGGGSSSGRGKEDKIK